MPELPEVETVVRDLRRKIKGKKIKQIDIRLSKIVKNQNKSFKDFLVGKKVKDITRRGKLIMIHLDSKTLLIHLKMTGQLILQKGKKVTAGGHSQKGMGVDDLPNKYSHVIFTFSDKSQLFYNDLRQFGYLKLASPAQLNKTLLKFGYEPLGADFTLAEFQKIVTKSKRNIKAFLLDQSLVVGLGNIYVDEVLFASKVRPQRNASSLKTKEIKSIFNNIQKILQRAIDSRGTTFNNYRDADGNKGKFTSLLKVYGRQDKKCTRKNCSSKIKKTKIAGRGTHFCPKCQK